MLADRVDEDFHVHIYFDERTRASAMSVREALAREPTFRVELQPVRDRPMGPHPLPMFNAHVAKSDLGALVQWLMRHRGPHAVLIHPNSGDDLADHAQYPMWLGGPLDLVLGNL